MALSLDTVWEVRQGGSDLNGGSFVSGGAGTDRSQQDAPHVDIDGAGISASVHATTTQVNLVGYVVSAADLDNTLQISGGTATAGFYRITAVDVENNRWTLDRAAGAAAATVIGRMGGAFGSPGRLRASMTTRNKAWIKAGTYTITTSTPGPDGPCHLLVSTVAIEGYAATRGDRAGRPVIVWGAAAPGSAVRMVSGESQLVHFYHLEVDGAGVANVSGIGFGPDYAYDCVARRCVTGIVTRSTRCSAYDCTSGIGGTDSRFCLAQSCTNGITGLRTFACIAISCANGFGPGAVVPISGIAALCTFGFRGDSDLPRVHCVAYACGTGFESRGVHFQCVAVLCTTHGFRLSDVQMVQTVRCATFGNAADVFGTGILYKSNEENIVLTADPYEDGAALDFRLNLLAGGGAALRAAGYGIPGQIDPRDIGAIPAAPDPSLVYTEAEYAAALAAGPPEVVDLADELQVADVSDEPEVVELL